MAAGLGFKDFVTGEVLTAADVDGYLMQGIWVFANATARDAAVTSPQEGNFAFLKDTNTTTYYTGSAWTNLDTTGMVNPMTTTGDTIYSSSGSTPARLGIGTAGQVLQVNSGATAPEWATPASGGGMTLISTTTLTGASVSLTSIPGTYKNLQLVLRDFYPSSSSTSIRMKLNNDTNNNLDYFTVRSTSTASANSLGGNDLAFNDNSTNQNNSDGDAHAILNFYDYAEALKQIGDGVYVYNTPSGYAFVYCTFIYKPSTSAAITSIQLAPGSGNFGGGTALLYGVS
jgi:hypothetical protein